jgi:hypothetical protein
VINSVARIAKPVECQVGLVVPAVVKNVEFSQQGYLNSIGKQEGGATYHWPQTFRILPGAWQNVPLRVTTGVTYSVGNVLGGLAVRVFTDSGYLDFPFAASMRANA